MREITVEQFLDEMKAQGVASPVEAVFVCPMCGTAQSAKDLIAAGAGKTFDEVEKFLAFSCVGRFTHGKPPPREKGTQVGCNWTLGGLFQFHELAVVTPDGKKHPRFRPASVEEARLYASNPAIRRVEISDVPGVGTASNIAVEYPEHPKSGTEEGDADGDD